MYTIRRRQCKTSDVHFLEAGVSNRLDTRRKPRRFIQIHDSRYTTSSLRKISSWFVIISIVLVVKSKVSVSKEKIQSHILHHPTIIDARNESSTESVCKPLVPWQNEIRPNCNTFHEFALTGAELINHGYIRSVWKVIGYEESPFVMKTLLFNHVRFSRSRMQDQAQDATISDQLSSSKFIANVYGYCKWKGANFLLL